MERKSVQTYKDYSDVRIIGRSVAKHKAKDAGYSRIGSKPILKNETGGTNKKGKSWFSENWKKIFGRA